jgi:hypothetical protein
MRQLLSRRADAHTGRVAQLLEAQDRTEREQLRPSLALTRKDSENERTKPRSVPICWCVFVCHACKAARLVPQSEAGKTPTARESGPNPEDDPPSVDRNTAGLDSDWLLGVFNPVRLSLFTLSVGLRPEVHQL